MTADYTTALHLVRQMRPEDTELIAALEGLAAFEPHTPEDPCPMCNGAGSARSGSSCTYCSGTGEKQWHWSDPDGPDGLTRIWKCCGGSYDLGDFGHQPSCWRNSAAPSPHVFRS